MTTLHGHAIGGPRNGKLLVATSRQRKVPGDESGFYIHQPASGPTPSGWRWVESKGPKK